MGRHSKIGLDYFPVDSNIMDNINITKLIHDFGTTGFAVYITIMIWLYKTGYYIKLDELLISQLSEKVGINNEETKKILNYIIDNLSLFDKNLYKSESILTSSEIQKLYIKFNQVFFRRNQGITKYNLLSPSVIPQESRRIRTMKYKKNACRICRMTFEGKIRNNIKELNSTEKGEFGGIWGNLFYICSTLCL